MRAPIPLLAALCAVFLTPCGAAEKPAAGPPVAAWGDSLTLGYGSAPGEDYPAIASSLFAPRRIVENHGMGGQTSTQIAARMGALPLAATVSGATIPGAGPVRVEMLSINVILDSAFGRGRVEGTLCGVHGLLVGHALRVTFNRDAPGAATSCAALSAFIPDRNAATQKGTVWLWFGRNGADPGRTIEADVAAAVAVLDHDRYLVASVLTASTDSDGQVGAIAAINANLKTVYGPRFVDVLAELLAAGNGSPEDIADAARGIVPRSLRTDFVHLTRHGNEIVAASQVAATQRLGF
jgi:hypothetical protein